MELTNLWSTKSSYKYVSMEGFSQNDTTRTVAAHTQALVSVQLTSGFIPTSAAHTHTAVLAVMILL